MKELLTGIFLCLSFLGFTQTDSVQTATTKTVMYVVKAPVSTSVKIAENDSNIRKNFVQNSLADALVLNNAVHVKSYGTGLQSVSFRGTGAEHTAVFWEGLPVNSSMNGITDFSHLPTFLLDNIQVNFGDGGAAYGSNVVGGSVHSRNGLIYRPMSKIITEVNAGSFGNYSGGLGYAWSNRRWSTLSKVFGHTAENNFKYEDRYSVQGGTKRMENNAWRNRGAVQHIGYKTGRHTIKLSGIWLNTSRELANVAASNSDEFQRDKSIRATLSHDYYKGHWTVTSRIGYTQEYLLYEDPRHVRDDYRVHGFIAKAKVRRKVCGGYATFFANYLRQNGSADNYIQNPKRETTDLGGHYWMRFGRMESRTTVRGTLFEGELLPLNFGQLLQLEQNHRWSFKTSVNSIYRIPTFNDLFWVNGGNEALKSEKGWKADLSISKKWNHGDIELTGFRMLVDDWIIWLPDDWSVWRPQNIRKVRSAGVELVAHKRFKIGKSKWIAKGIYSYTDSRNKAVQSGASATINKQLIYVPFHKFGNVLSVNLGGWKWVNTVNYTGRVFTTTPNTKSLDPFWIWSTSFSRSYGTGKTKFLFSLSVRNLLGSQYELVENRPMPGRSIWAKITYSFDSKWEKPKSQILPIIYLNKNE